MTSSLSILAKYESVKDNLRKYKCTSCNKYSSNNLDEEFEKRFKNTFTFSNNDVNKFILLFRKGIILLAEKREFYHNLKWRILQMQIKCMQKEFVKTLE